MGGATLQLNRYFRLYLVLTVLLCHTLRTTPTVSAQVTPTGGSHSVTTTPSNANVTTSQLLGNSTSATTLMTSLGNTTSLSSTSLPSNVTNSTTNSLPGNSTNVTNVTPLLSNITNSSTMNPLLGNSTNITTVSPLPRNVTSVTTMDPTLSGNSTNLTTVSPLVGNRTYITTLIPMVNGTNGTARNETLNPFVWDWSVTGIVIGCSVVGVLQLVLLGLCCFLYARRRKSVSLKKGSEESLSPGDGNDIEDKPTGIIKSTKDNEGPKEDAQRTKSAHRVTIVENKEELLARTVPTPASQRRALKTDNSGIGGIYFPNRYKMPVKSNPPTRMYSVSAHVGGKPVTIIRPVDAPTSTPPPPGWMDRFGEYLKLVGSSASSGNK